MVQVAERVTINLTAKGSAALAERSIAEGLSKTDVINRSLQLYAALMQEVERGRKLAVINGERVEILRIL